MTPERQRGPEQVWGCEVSTAPTAPPAEGLCTHQRNSLLGARRFCSKAQVPAIYFPCISEGRYPMARRSLGSREAELPGAQQPWSEPRQH